MTARERHNAICNVTGETLWGFQSSMILPATVLTVLLTQLGASKAMVGLIPSLDGLILFMSIFGIHLFRSHKKRKLRIIVFHYLAMVPLLAAMGALVLAHDSIPRDVLKFLLLGCWAAFMASMGIVVSSWVDWMAHLFRREIRGTITGVAWGCSNLAGAAGALTSGWALHRYTTIVTFGWLYLAASVFAALSITVFFAIRDPAKDLADDFAPSFRETISASRESLSDAAFRSILIGRCLSLAGFCVGPFIALHYLSPIGGGLSEGLVVSFGAASTTGTAICCLLFGRIGDRIGHRFGMIMGICFQLGSLLSVLSIPGPIGCFLAMLFSGCTNGTLIISSTNLLLESCPHQVRAAHVMIGNMLVGLAGVLLPILGARIAIQAGITALMEVSFVVSVVALVWNIYKVKDPRGPRKPAGEDFLPPVPHIR